MTMMVRIRCWAGTLAMMAVLLAPAGADESGGLRLDEPLPSFLKKVQTVHEPVLEIVLARDGKKGEVRLRTAPSSRSGYRTQWDIVPIEPGAAPVADFPASSSLQFKPAEHGWAEGTILSVRAQMVRTRDNAVIAEGFTGLVIGNDEGGARLIADPLVRRWAWLAGTFWYVPTAYLPAVEYVPSSGDVVPVLDQTLWVVEGYRYGYFWGRTYVQLTAFPGEPEPLATEPMTFVGSVTPDGEVLMNFMPEDSTAAAAQSTQGKGNMLWRDGQWVFRMQMASGVTSLIAHWAWMLETSPGDPSWDRLPGTTLSVPEFIAAESGE